MNYSLPDGYIERLDNEAFDDTPYKDEHQDEVYKHARMLAEIHGYHTILDYGCGSGYKLMKYFNDFETIGVELEPTLSFVKNTYPNGLWANNTEGLWGIEMVICSDVIEHVKYPNQLLKEIHNLKPGKLVISTPDRDLLNNHTGPPRNTAHVREWSYEEFEKFVKGWFKIEDHFISNVTQATQVIVGTCK